MRKRLFHRRWTQLAAAVVSIGLTACGGGSDAPEAEAASAQPSAQTIEGDSNDPVAENPFNTGRVLAADAGAATQDPL